MSTMRQLPGYLDLIASSPVPIYLAAIGVLLIV